jgi:hypothetical protein
MHRPWASPIASLQKINGAESPGIKKEKLQIEASSPQRH